MTWIKFLVRKPKNGSRLITRSLPTYGKEGDSFEDWREWDNKNLKNIRPTITHWWDGEFNFDLAVDQWKEDNEKEG